jgi:hypothetical protein
VRFNYVVAVHTKEGINLYFNATARAENAGTTASRTYNFERARRWKTEAGAKAFRDRHAPKGRVIAVQAR